MNNDLAGQEANDAPLAEPDLEQTEGGDGADGKRQLDIEWDLGPDEDLSYDCPRCQQATTAHHYGPCSACRQQLRANLSGEARDVEAADYEPKMNVTPNAIATKE